MNDRRKAWYSIKNDGRKAVEIAIYDEIGAFGITAKDFIAELNRIPKGTEITLAINSGGGMVFDAFNIYNNLVARRENLVARVDGVAASSASFIALSGRRLVMPENAMLMIHEPQGFVIGTADDMRKEAELLDKIRDPIAGIYEKKSGKARADIESAMKKETWFSAREAQEFGLADEVIESIEVTAAVDLSKFRNPPQILNKVTTTPTSIMKAVLEKLVALKVITSADLSEKDALEQIQAAFDLNMTATTRLKDEMVKAKEANQALREQIAKRSVSDAIAAGKIANDDLSVSLWLKMFTDAPDEATKMLATIPAQKPENKAAAKPAKPSGAGDPLPVKPEDGGSAADDILDRYNAMEEGREKDQFLAANQNALLRLDRQRKLLGSK